MSYLDLMNALRDKGEEKAATLWLHVEAEAQRIRTEAANQIEATKVDQARAHARTQESITKGIRMEAARSQREMWSAAKSRVAERCYQLARQSLSASRNPDDDGLFRALADELPEEAWEEVRVHPVDRDRAARRFPGARVVTDPDISGGLEVVGRGGRLRIRNTLEKRLERAWPDLLPAIVHEIEGEVKDVEPSA
jgi:V/A-type H+-transporting ATPase subunit E